MNMRKTKSIETKLWNDMELVRVSSIPRSKEFRKWMFGQTVPLVSDDKDPLDWAYAWDYERFASNLPVID